MDVSHSYTLDSPCSMPLTVSTTGITDIELSCIDIPAHIKISPKLTPNTQLIITYKAIFTKKYIKSLNWNIPVVSIQYLYDPLVNYKKYEMKPFQGAVFSTSGITEEIFSNYFVVQGAIYEPNCSIFIDFLICDNEDSEKYKFCKNYGIPIIKTKEVFQNNYDIFLKNTRYDAKQIKPLTLFFEKVFYLDQNLPKNLFNKLRRLIVENEGTRISTLNDEANYILTNNYEKYKEYADKIVHYQYVFDCVHSNSILYSEFYKFNNVVPVKILENVVAVVDKSVSNEIECINKLKSLGASVKSSIDMRTTHFISNKKLTFENTKENLSNSLNGKIKERVNYITVLPEWVNQCLYVLKHVKEDKFIPNGNSLSLKKRTNDERKSEEYLFQFTGLPSLFKQQAINKFKEFNIKYSESNSYENCTHLIMGEFGLSEKFLGALVSGKWILTPDFITNFDNQKSFDFSKYEWASNADTPEKDRKKIDSIRIWRERIQSGGKKPFHKWNVKLLCSDDKIDGYSKLIKNGGGGITEKDDYTHIFADKTHLEEANNTKVTSIDKIFLYLFK